MMSEAEMQAMMNGQHLTVIRSHCPLYPKATVTLTHQQTVLTTAEAVFAEVISHPTGFRQIEAWARVAAKGAHHKRGPPSLQQS